MKYRIDLAATAKADIRETTEWLCEEVSQTVADKWLSGLETAINTLQSFPKRCPLAQEHHKFAEEIRVRFYGKKPNSYRIIFTIRKNTVVILYIHRRARDEIEP